MNTTRWSYLKTGRSSSPLMSLLSQCGQFPERQLTNCRPSLGELEQFAADIETRPWTSDIVRSIGRTEHSQRVVENSTSDTQLTSQAALGCGISRESLNERNESRKKNSKTQLIFLFLFSDNQFRVIDDWKSNKNDQSYIGIQQSWKAATIKVLRVLQRRHATANHQGDVSVGLEAGRQRVQFFGGRKSDRRFGLQTDIPSLRDALLRLLRRQFRVGARYSRPDTGVRRDARQVFRERMRARSHISRRQSSLYTERARYGRNGLGDEHDRDPDEDRGAKQIGKAGGGNHGGDRPRRFCSEEHEYTAADKGHEAAGLAAGNKRSQILTSRHFVGS